MLGVLEDAGADLTGEIDVGGLDDLGFLPLFTHGLNLCVLT
jgi:hypothetical protein